MNPTYGFGTTLNVPYEAAIQLVKEALKAEGFGVLTEIDVRQTLREKLGAEMEPSLILGACNPQLAHRALEQEPDTGLLLPCNVVVRSLGQGSRVDIADPQAVLGIVGNAQIGAVADEAKQHLQRVVAALGGQALRNVTIVTVCSPESKAVTSHYQHTRSFIWSFSVCLIGPR